MDDINQESDSAGGTHSELFKRLTSIHNLVFETSHKFYFSLLLSTKIKKTIQIFLFGMHSFSVKCMINFLATDNVSIEENILYEKKNFVEVS